MNPVQKAIQHLTQRPPEVSAMNRTKSEKSYEGLSPFEFKNKLIDMAGSLWEKVVQNAGRGNPNWVATKPREAFLSLAHLLSIRSRLGMADAPDSKKNAVLLTREPGRIVKEVDENFGINSELYCVSTTA